MSHVFEVLRASGVEHPRSVGEIKAEIRALNWPGQSLDTGIYKALQEAMKKKMIIRTRPGEYRLKRSPEEAHAVHASW